jgi:hypothetical protein
MAAAGCFCDDAARRRELHQERGAPTLVLAVAPDSGTGELTGLSGQMQIEIKEGGQHSYRFEHEL